MDFLTRPEQGGSGSTHPALPPLLGFAHAHDVNTLRAGGGFTRKEKRIAHPQILPLFPPWQSEVAQEGSKK